jgi:sulfur-carrier protein
MTNNNIFKKIKIHYFAHCREARGCSNENVCSSAETAKDLFAEINLKYSLDDDVNNLKVAVNDRFVDWQYQLKDGDQIAFIPPVCGG